MKKFLVLLMIGALILGLAGCQGKDSSDNNKDNDNPALTQTPQVVASENEPEKWLAPQNPFPDFVIEETEETVTFDSLEGIVTITKHPKRVVVIQNSLLDLWYLAGGEAIARVEGTTNVPEAALDIMTVGTTSGFSAELVLELEPDLVILSTAFTSHRNLIPILEENNIEYAPMTANMTPYEGFIKNLYLFSRILEREDIYQSTVKKIADQVASIIDSVKDHDKPSTVILFSSTRDVQCELPNSLAGEMVHMLGAINIVGDSVVEGGNKVSFSMETIVEKDPDYVLITTMGDFDAIKDKLEAEIMSNEAWKLLTAVKEGRVYFLPSELFMYRPNEDYPEAFRILREILFGVSGE